MADVTRFILVPSPLTGPLLWARVCDELWALGQRAFVARLTSTDYIYAPFWLSQAAGVAASLPDEGEIVLVAHSGAGVLLPAIGRFHRNRELESVVRGYLFVDCDLPSNARSRLDLFDDRAAAETLRTRAADGFMPRWTSRELEPLVADAAVRDAFVAELPRVPIDVYEELINVPEDWPEAACGYLRLSDHYPSAVREAERRDWPLEHLTDSHHLAPLSQPHEVAAALCTLLTGLENVTASGKT